MKRILIIISSFFLLAIFLTACNNANFESSQASATDAYSSEEAAYDEDNRKVIKTAQISLQVDQLEKSIIDLKSFLKPINGYVYNYEISNQSHDTDQFQKNMDSSVIVQKISPQGNLSIRVPIVHADSFINYVLQSDAQISSLKITDDDITENLWEKKEVAEVYAGSGKAQRRQGNSESISYDNNTAINAIKAKALAAKMDYKTKYLWFDMTLSATPFYSTTTTIAAKNYRTPMHVSLANAMSSGWYIFADIIVGLVTVWPLLLLLGLGYILFKKYRLRHD